MTRIKKRSTCPISSSLDLLGDKWSLLVMRDLLFRDKAHYRELLASEEGIATNILAERLERLEAGGLIEKSGEHPRSGKQTYVATAKGQDLIPLLLEMMLWGARHLPQTDMPSPLRAELERDRAAAARGIRDQGGIEAFLGGLGG